MNISGYTENTLENVTSGAGVVFKNFDLATDTVESARAKIISATQGGVKVKIEFPSAWDREIDGVPANSVGMREREECKPTVTMTLAEVASPQVLADALGAALVEDATAPTGYKKITPKWDVETTDYLQNIAVVTTRKGSNDPLIIVIDNPLSTEGFELATASKSGGGMEVTFTGNYNPLQLDVCPVHFYSIDTTA
jgi:hypothetical protein